jgi:uncharacterized phiE125 gp8 family phage protein
MPSFKLITPPAVEPVTLDETKAHARIDTTADDVLITGLIAGARQWAEAYSGRAFINQTWQLWIDQAPTLTESWWDGVRQGPIGGLDCISAIPLPRPPLATVNHVQYFDNLDNATTWDPGNYFVDTIGEPGRLTLRIGATWPVATRLTNSMVIEYVVGYGADAGSVPDVIKTAICQLVSHWYEHRGEAAVATTRGTPVLQVPLVIQALLDPYRIRRLAV